ncbi:AtpZ/AtpI family protein [Wenyingzhuangia heitensis]
MFLASKLGNLVDEYYQFKKPWITLLFIILALVIFVMNLMRQLNKLNNE